MTQAFLCDWDEHDTCRHCRRTFASRPRATCPELAKQNPHTAAPARGPRESLTCRHIGPCVELVSVTCCGGEKTRHKVFACAVHGKCQLAPKVNHVHCCARCEEFL